MMGLHSGVDTSTLAIDGEVSAAHVFNTQAFLTMRSWSIGQPPEPLLTHFLDSHGSMDYLERGLGSDENTNNLLDKLLDAIRRGQNPISILTSNIGSPYSNSLKILEADIQHANNLAASIPRRKSDTVLQMKLVYDHLAPIFLFLLQWIDCSSSCF